MLVIAYEGLLLHDNMLECDLVKEKETQVVGSAAVYTKAMLYGGAGCSYIFRNIIRYAQQRKRRP